MTKKFCRELRKPQTALHARPRVYVPLDVAVSKRFAIDFDANPPAPTPRKLGLSVITTTTIEDVVPYIDWNPFFQTWELRGTYPNRGYPKIFNDAKVCCPVLVQNVVRRGGGGLFCSVPKCCKNPFFAAGVFSTLHLNRSGQRPRSCSTTHKS